MRWRDPDCLAEAAAGHDQEPPFQALTRRFGFLYAETVIRWADEPERELGRLGAGRRSVSVEER